MFWNSDVQGAVPSRPTVAHNSEQGLCQAWEYREPITEPMFGFNEKVMISRYIQISVKHPCTALPYAIAVSLMNFKSLELYDLKSIARLSKWLFLTNLEEWKSG